MSTRGSGSKDKISLDQATLKKLKQHNKSIYQQKKQDAVALRQKLEQWKDEKRKKKMQEQKKVPKPFMTTVLKPAQEKTQPKAKGFTKQPVGQKPVTKLSNKTVHKPVCGPAKSQMVAAKPGQKKIPLKKEAVLKSKSGRQLRPTKGKENDKPANTAPLKGTDATTGKGSASAESVSDCSKLSASEMTTPLSRNTASGIHEVVTKLTSREDIEQGIIAKPLRLADELNSALCVDTQVVSENTTESGGEKCSQRSAGNKDKLVHATARNSRSSPRISLTARFHKSKNQQLASAKNAASTSEIGRSVPHSTAAKKTSSLSSFSSRKPSVSNPPKSILKQISRRFSLKSSDESQSSLGASPLLPPASKRRKTTGDGATVVSEHEKAGEKSPGKDSQGTTSSLPGHVSFAVDVGSLKGEGATFRKTPAKRKMQESMRMRLNEWLEAKGCTPSKLRHAGCFSCNSHASRQQTPRSQVKACMSVEQLSRQESTLTKEDKFTTLGQTVPLSKKSSSRTCSAVQTVSCVPHNLASDVCHAEKTSPASEPESGHENKGMAHQGMEVEKTEVEEHGRGNRAEDVMEMDASSVSETVSDGSMLQIHSMDQLNCDFQKCLTCIENGSLGAKLALEWLDLISDAYDEVQHHVGWYRCRVAALKLSADQDALLAVFQQAIINSAQPVQEMAQLLTDTMKELLSQKPRAKCRRKSVPSQSSASSARSQRSSHRLTLQPQVQTDNVFESTTVKYSVLQVTPFKKRRRATEGGEGVVPVITPVRRSARCGFTPASEGRLPRGTPHVTEYSALEEVPSEEKKRMLFQPNQALEPFLNDESPEVKRLSMEVAE